MNGYVVHPRGDPREDGREALILGAQANHV